MDTNENVECLYCEGYFEVRGVDPEEVPAVTDDAAWDRLAKAHTDGCEWVRTRAHRINLED
jgi:hypothetical protein